MNSINNFPHKHQYYLQVLSEFLETSEGNFIDFEIEKNPQAVSDLLSITIEPYFIPIGKQASQSLICYWRYQNELSLEQLPIVWLDSEGTPNSVFATNIEDFISILFYDTGGIYDFISSWEYYNSQPGYYISPLNEYEINSSALNLMITKCRETYPDYDLFVNWIEKNISIKICENPIKLVGDAMKKFPNLQLWLEQKGII
jgi:hypothetical protein